MTSVLPMAADGRTNAEPYFTFSGEPGVQYACRLNSADYNKNPCQPGRTFPRSGNPRVAEGANTLRITATDKAGNTSGESAPFTFLADTTIPTVTISSPSENQVTGTEVRFVFRASQTAGTRYGCRIDGHAFVRCEQPSDAGGAGRPFAVENLPDGSVAVTYRNLSVGEHTFQVHASDNHNNVSPNASRNIRVDLSSPVALIDAPGIGETTGPSTTLRSHIDPATIGAGETNTLTCTLRRGTTNVPLSECDESIPVSGLQSGEHTFTVQARDSAGNTGPQASRTWTVDGTGPVITIVRTPTGFLGQGSPRFTITTNEPAALMCRFDNRPMQDCAVVNGTNLGRGQHTLFVTGTDAYGNASQAQNTFTIGPLGADDPTVVVPANRLVPVSITQANLRALGLPITFNGEEDAALAQVRILRAVKTTPTLTRAATSSTSKKKVTYKRIITLTRKPKQGNNRMRLKDRVIRNLLKPGAYKVELRQRRKSGKYGKALSATMQVKSSKPKKKSK